MSRQTPREYGTPAAFRQAVEQHLKNDAMEKNVTLDHRRQVFIYERFIARLVKVFGKRFVIAGGVALEFLVERARTTKDIDIHLGFSAEAALPKLQEAGNLTLGDYLDFRIADDQNRRDEGIAIEGLEHPVRRFHVRTRLGGVQYGHPFHLDLIVIDPPYYQPNEIVGSDFLSFKGEDAIRFNVCPPEIAIGEKLHAYTKPRFTANSRVRDLPDIGLLARSFEFECESLLASIRLVFEQYGTHPVPDRLSAPPADWALSYAKLAGDNSLEWPDVERLFVEINRFLGPVLEGMPGRWSPKEWRWRSASRPGRSR